MIEFLDNLDTSIFLAVNGANSPFFDSFMTMFTGRFIWIPMYAMILWILFRSCRWQTAMVYLLSLVCAIVLTDQVCASVIRPAVERLRPSNIENSISGMAYIVNGYRGGSYGFPSCHAANSFALTVFVALFVRRRAFTLFIVGWALLNSYSRLYLGVHYPGDLLVGAIIGSFLGFVCYHAARMSAGRLIEPQAASGGHQTIGVLDSSRVILKQLTPGAALRSLTPSASLLREISTVRVYRLVASDLMIAAFALTLAVIVIASILN